MDEGMAPLIIWWQQKRGRATKLALHLGIKPQALYSWNRVPSRHVREVSKHTKIPLYKLRPDLYHRASKLSAAVAMATYGWPL